MGKLYLGVNEAEAACEAVYAAADWRTLSTGAMPTSARTRLMLAWNKYKNLDY